MTTANRLTPEQWLDLARGLAGRNAAVELTAVTPDAPDRLHPTYRARLLAAEVDGGVVIDRPRRLGVVSELAPGTAVDLVISSDAQRWRARAVIGSVLRHDLNDRVSVVALRLLPPEVVESAQRRDHYRASQVSGQAKLTAVPEGAEREAMQFRVRTQGKKDPPAPELKGGFSFGAQLTNLSGGGLALAARRSQALMDALSGRPLWWCELSLSIDDLRVAMPLRVMRAEVDDDGDLRLGCAFVFSSPLAPLRAEDEMGRLNALVQRRLLQRQRGLAS